MADAASAEYEEGELTLTARRLASGKVAARRRAPASLVVDLVVRKGQLRARLGTCTYSTSLKRSVSMMRFFFAAMA